MIFIVLSSLALFTANVAGNGCTISPPDHVRFECRIVTEESGCFKYEEGDWLINQCDYSSACHVWTGVQLDISCGDDYSADPSLELFRDNGTVGSHVLSWPFATSSAVEGLYQCRRRSDGSVVSNRSVIVDGE